MRRSIGGEGSARARSALWLVAAAFAASLIIVHFWYGNSIFDIELADETVYMSMGLMAPVNMSAYENSGLYSMYYRALSFILSDPIRLHLWAGLILFVLSSFAVFWSLGILSRSPIYALIATAGFLLSGVFLVQPRISFFAIALVALGIGLASRVRPLFCKSGIFLLASFLVAFVRPEYVLAFYIFLAATVAIGCFEIVRAISLRTGSARALLPGWASAAAVLLLALAWSFPLMRSDQRAFIAFSQHFAFGQALENKSDVHPGWNFRAIVERAFPGATSVTQAFTIAPATFTKSMLANAIAGVRQLGLFLGRAFNPLPSSLLRRLAMWVLVGCALGLSLRKLRPPALAIEQQKARHIGAIANSAAIIVLVLPPAIACIIIFPRDHYLIIVLYLLLALIAVGICRIGEAWSGAGSVGVIALAGVGLLIATPTLPVSSQPVLHYVELIRRVPGIKVMYEADGGWCFYYLPPCRTIFPELGPNPPLQETLARNDVDALMMSPGLRSVETIANQPFFRELARAPERYGFRAIALSSDWVLLKR